MVKSYSAFPVTLPVSCTRMETMSSFRANRASLYALICLARASNDNVAQTAEPSLAEERAACASAAPHADTLPHTVAVAGLTTSIADSEPLPLPVQPPPTKAPSKLSGILPWSGEQRRAAALCEEETCCVPRFADLAVYVKTVPCGTRRLRLSAQHIGHIGLTS